jgi:hypothetical protein
VLHPNLFWAGAGDDHAAVPFTDTSTSWRGFLPFASIFPGFVVLA